MNAVLNQSNERKERGSPARLEPRVNEMALVHEGRRSLDGIAGAPVRAALDEL